MAIIKLITTDADEGVRKGDACHLLLVMYIRSPEPDQYGGTSKTQNYHITSLHFWIYTKGPLQHNTIYSSHVIEWAKCLLAYEQINKIGYICTIEFYLAIAE